MGNESDGANQQSRENAPLVHAAAMQNCDLEEHSKKQLKIHVRTYGPVISIYSAYQAAFDDCAIWSQPQLSHKLFTMSYFMAAKWAHSPVVTSTKGFNLQIFDLIVGWRKGQRKHTP